MSKLQTIEILIRTLSQIHNAMDEIDEIVDNEDPKNYSLKYLMEAEMTLNALIDDLELQAVTDGTKSGAV